MDERKMPRATTAVEGHLREVALNAINGALRDPSFDEGRKRRNHDKGGAFEDAVPGAQNPFDVHVFFAWRRAGE